MKLLALSALMVLLAGPAVAAENLDETFQSLKDAVAKKDPAQVKKFVADLGPMIKEDLAKPAPAGADEKKDWASHNEYVKSVGEYCEYALYATAVQSPSNLVDLIGALEKFNPASKYLDQAYLAYFAALNQAGAGAKIPAIAEEALKHFPENEDLLLVAMENAQTKNQADRALGYANRIIAAMPRRAKPENMAAGDWERKRATALGQAYYVAGAIYASKGTYSPADKDLRAALPLIKGNNAMMGPALFYLGLANYNLGKMMLNKKLVQEAADFMQQSSMIPGQFAAQASHNAQVMKNEAGQMR